MAEGTNASKRFFGEVGYAIPHVNEYGVDSPIIEKRKYYGDILKLGTRWQDTEHLNDNIVVQHRISILADPYAIEHFPYIKYVEWLGTRWDVKSVDVEYPRLVLTLGGVYNGPQD